MRTTTIFILQVFLICFLAVSLNAQVLNDITQPSLSKNSLAEKIYLQIDNMLYQTGETIWFKAVVSKSYDNSLTDLSRVLHVELIDSDEKIIDNQLLKLNNGIANGFFSLQKSYKSGKHQIRAYTIWNKNFEEDFMFTQSIDIVNLKVKEEEKNPILNIVVEHNEFKILKADIKPRLVDPSYKGKLKLYIKTVKGIDSVVLDRTKDNIYKLNYKLEDDINQAELKFVKTSKNRFNKNNNLFFKKSIVIDKDYLDIQFFPEGGKMVNGIVSTVGFKSIDFNGLGQQVEGIIKDNNGNDITSFKSNKLGMGTFKLLPKISLSYYAEIYNNDILHTYNLPIPKKKGSVLSLVNLKDEIRLSVVSKNNAGENVTLETSSRGVKYHSFKFKQKDTIITSIPETSLPAGVIKMSVINVKGHTICERLFFNRKKDNRLDLELSSDKSTYLQREKVQLNINLDSLQAIEETSLSVLVLNKERTDISKKYKPNMLAYLLLNSELKGFIENPSYYFDNTNKQRFIDLDALMLTQGWRDYKYSNSLPSTTYNIEPEQFLELSGTIGEYFNPQKRPKKPLDLNLMIKSEAPMVYNQEISSTGKYRFQLDDFYKTNAEFFMQVVDKKGSPIDFKINVDKKWVPEIKLQKQKSFTIPNFIKTEFSEQMEVVNNIQQNYETTYNTIALDEVTVKGYKMTAAREKLIELHGEPTTVIDGKELNKNPPKWNFGVLSVIRAQFPDKVMIIDEGPRNNPFLRAVVRGTEYAGGFTYILVDNIPVAIREYRFIQSIPVEEVTGIDILESPRNKNEYCYEVLKPAGNCPTYVALINIYTKSKNGINGIIKTKGFKIDEIQGFKEYIEFYAPNYETLSNQDWVIPDNRSVIHWSPDIKLNEKGECLVEFYNDDHIGEVSVIVEAISQEGKIGYVEKTYTVKEAER